MGRIHVRTLLYKCAFAEFPLADRGNDLLALIETETASHLPSLPGEAPHERFAVSQQHLMANLNPYEERTCPNKLAMLHTSKKVESTVSTSKPS